MLTPIRGFVVLVGDCAALLSFGSVAIAGGRHSYEHGCDKQQSANCLAHNLVMIWGV